MSWVDTPGKLNTIAFLVIALAALLLVAAMLWA
jgi:hypothetical protein